MSAALERRLRRAFARLPAPSRDISKRARAAAMATLPPEPPRARAWLVLVAFAAALVVGAGAAALAATGNLHVKLGESSPRGPRAQTGLSIPRGTNGIAVVVGGRLWLTTRHGFRIEGMPATAAELSPRALYAAVGVGSSLVALAPGRRRAWTHETGGPVVAAAWSPDGLKIAYVVDRNGRHELRLIEGDGDHDRLVDPRASAVKPSWRSDALAVAYVRAGRRAAVYHLGTATRRVFNTSRCGGPARAVAYAPGKKRLAVAGQSGVALVERWNRAPSCVAFDRLTTINALAWLSQRSIVTSDNPLQGIGADSAVRRFHLGTIGLNGGGAAFSSRTLLGVASAPGGGSLAVALEPAPGVLELGISPSPAVRSSGRLRVGRSLLRLRVHAAAVSISWR
jgi:hypothetical protein